MLLQLSHRKSSEEYPASIRVVGLFAFRKSGWFSAGNAVSVQARRKVSIAVKSAVSLNVNTFAFH